MKRNMRLVGIIFLIGLTGCAVKDESFGTPEVVDNALAGQLYLLPEGTLGLPDFTRLSPVGTVYTTKLDVAPHDFKQGFPEVVDRLEWFGLQYRGVLRIRSAGTYTFGLNSDDGSKLYIGSQLVISNDFLHDPKLETAQIYLDAGEYPLTLEYFQGPRFEIALQFFITPPGRERQIFNSTVTY